MFSIKLYQSSFSRFMAAYLAQHPAIQVERDSVARNSWFPVPVQSDWQALGLSPDGEAVLQAQPVEQNAR